MKEELIETNEQHSVRCFTPRPPTVCRKYNLVIPLGKALHCYFYKYSESPTPHFVAMFSFISLAFHTDLSYRLVPAGLLP